jgi:NAD(P)-dependent dehydrogenase (short-subunit alcohol dehydrogenase family)
MGKVQKAALRQQYTVHEALRPIELKTTEAEDLRRLVDTTVERFGGVDILVNNAALTVGSAWSKTFLDLTFEEWTQQFDVNLHAPFLLMQLVAPIMAARGGGRIVNVTTGSGEVSRKPEEPVKLESIVGRNLIVPGYYSSKRALDRLANVIAPELRGMNVFVIGMHPGWVGTEIVHARLQKQNFDPKEGDVRPVPTAVPARMIVYFASCEQPEEYTGRLFWAEREMADMGVPFDPTDTGAEPTLLSPGHS